MGKTEREKQRERERGHIDRVMVADTEVHSAVRVWCWRHRPGSVCRCPLTAPLTFIPPPLPHCPTAPPAVRQSDCEGVAAQRGYIKGPERWEAQGLMLAHNKVSHKRRTVLKKQSKLTPSQRRAWAEQNISFSSPNQHYASLASNNSDEILSPLRLSLAFFTPPHLLLSAPTANGPLECVNKRDNLIKKIQSSSLGNKVRFEWVQYVPPLPSTPSHPQSRFIISFWTYQRNVEAPSSFERLTWNRATFAGFFSFIICIQKSAGPPGPVYVAVYWI